MTELTPGEKKAMEQDVSRDELERVLSGGGLGCGAVMACRLARTALELHAQLADADMAQAALVERIAAMAEEGRLSLVSDSCAAQIRALAPDVGVQALAALRAAVKPLVEAAKDRAASAPEWRDHDTVSVLLTIGELRAALAALLPPPGGDDEGEG